MNLLAIKKGAVVIDTSLNTQKIEQDFKTLDKRTQNLVNKYNKSVDKIKSQELAISKVKGKLEELVNGDKTPTSIKNLQSELRKTEKELITLQKQYDRIISEINSKSETLKFELEMGDMKDPKVISSLESDISSLSDQSIILATKLENVRDKSEKLNQSLASAQININNSKEIQQLNNELEIMNSKLSQSKEEANQLKNEISDTFDSRKQLLGFDNGIENIGNKIDKFKKKITRLVGTVAIFNLLRNSLTNLRNGFMSILKSDDNFNSSLNQIKANLMTAFAPIYTAVLPAINSLMNSLSKLTGTIAIFISNLFGQSLSDSTKQAKKLSKALDKTKKSGEEASGSLASFDKLEVINDTSSKGTTSNEAGIDYSGEIQYSTRLLEFLNGIKNFISQNREYILALFAGIASGLLAIKLGASGILGLGIGLVITGIILLIQDVINFLNDPTWEGFGKIITDIGILLLGLAVIFGGIPLAIAAGIAIIVGLIISNWETITGILSGVGDWIYKNVINPVINFFKNNWQGLLLFIVNPFAGAFKLLYDNCEGFRKTVDNMLSKVKNAFSTAFNSVKNTIKNIWNQILKLFKTGGQIFNGLKNGIVDVFQTIVNALIDGINKIISTPFNKINGLLNTIRNVEVLKVKPFKGLWSQNPLPVPKIPKLATGTVIPPRHEFMAILGDQKHGTNIEAPLETIKQANREVMEEFIGSLMGLNNNEREIVFKNLTIVAQFGKKDFTKLVVEAVRLAERELGKPLFIN